MTRWTYALVFGTALFAVLLFNLVQAQGGGTIHSCVRDQDGRLVIVGENERCFKRWTPLSWSVQGAQGIQGPQGPPGPASSLLPVAYASVTLDGTALAGTSNVSVSLKPPGTVAGFNVYAVTIDGHIYTAGQYVTLVTALFPPPGGHFDGVFTEAEAGNLLVYTNESTHRGFHFVTFRSP